MKVVKWIFALMLLSASVAAQNAWADRGHFHHHGHAHVGVVIGAPLGWPWWYEPSYPYYYPYQPIIVDPGPTEYIERGQPRAADSDASNYWYYCQKPDGYYPYVKECPGGWERVTPQPPAPRH
ncbi:MAG TPA: hypothetical protein DEQ40_11480 [Oxalobacteraceae bacterium]|jgi:hypothetical protein|nr:hypothetical protein [Oxalobacteraceae bacterium]